MVVSVALFIDNESNECIHEAKAAAEKGPGDLRDFFEAYFLPKNVFDNIVVAGFLVNALNSVDWVGLCEHFSRKE